MKGGECFLVDEKDVCGNIVSSKCSKRPRNVAAACDGCGGILLALNAYFIKIMKKCHRAAAIGLSLEKLGDLLTENYYSIQ
jgi:hypothetical protein